MTALLQRLYLAAILLVLVVGVFAYLFRDAKDSRPAGVELPTCPQGTNLVESTTVNDRSFADYMDFIFSHIMPAGNDTEDSFGAESPIYYAFCVKEEMSLKEVFTRQPKEGPYRSWFETGKLAQEGQFKGDSETGYWKEWYKNGNLYRQGEYKNGEFEGPWDNHYPNGNLSIQCDHINGEHNGHWIAYHKNGVKSVEGEWRMSNKVGIWHHWNDKGEPTKEVNHGGIPNPPPPTPNPQSPPPAP